MVSPGVLEGLQLCFDSPTPGVLGSSLLAFSLWCPVEGCSGDVLLFPSADMSYQSPSPSHDDCVHAFLVATDQKFLVGDGLRPEDTQDSSEILRVECGQFVKVTLSHPPAFQAI